MAEAGGLEPGTTKERTKRTRREAAGTPRAWALRAEAGQHESAAPAAGWSEHFAGYGVLALPFEGGDLLTFRRYPVSSVGPAYSAIWHRDHRGGWTFYSTTEPELSCPRYFGSAIDRAVVTDIAVTWVGHDHLVVSAPARRVEWSMRLASTPASRLASLAAAGAGVFPARNPAVLSLTGRVMGLALGAGPLRLEGRTPNGQRFRATHRRVWRIAAAAALIEGRELGRIGGGAAADLADFRLPGSPLFACGSDAYEALDPARHSTRLGCVLERS